jgi:transcription elongation factor Elf1
MGRRKKRKTFKTIHWTKRRPPKTFQCPECGSISISVKIEEKDDKRIAYIACSNPRCRLRSVVKDIPLLAQPVDVYGRFIDGYFSGTAEVWFEEKEEAGEETEERGNVSE